MLQCKKCGAEKIVKSGMVAGKQRYHCGVCGCNFRLGDKRTDEKIAAKKALCILLYALTKNSYRAIGRIFDIDHSLAYRWIRSFGEKLPTPKGSDTIKQMNFDELWQSIELKQESHEPLKVLITTHNDLLPEQLTNPILQHIDKSKTK